MKNLVLAFCLLIGTAVFAQKDRGGGDPCEARFKIIRDDLYSWLSKGGFYGLLLPPGTSAQAYFSKMASQIGKAQIKCVGQGDESFPVEVYGTPKVCRFDLTDNKSLITCDFSKFQSLNEEEQYALVHHEYAGLAQIERPNSDDSDYSVSNQLSVFLVDQVVKRLAIKPGSAGTAATQKVLTLFDNVNLRNDITGETYHATIDLRNSLLILTAVGVFFNPDNSPMVLNCKDEICTARREVKNFNSQIWVNFTLIWTVRLSTDGNLVIEQSFDKNEFPNQPSTLGEYKKVPAGNL